MLCSSELERRIIIGRGCAEVPISGSHPTTDGDWIGLSGRDDLTDVGTRYSQLFVAWEELGSGNT